MSGIDAPEETSCFPGKKNVQYRKVTCGAAAETEAIMATELEIKYAVGDLLTMDCILCDPMVGDLLGAYYENIQMQTVYYDTPSGLLSSRKWALRLRKENDKSIITLKTPGEGYARGEWEYEGEYLEDAVPALIALGAPSELRELLEKESPVPVCGAKFVRITAPMTLSDGTCCTICGDIGSLNGGTRSEALCELELELQSGSEETMLSYAHALAEKYHLHEEHQSKFARAHALAAKG